MVITVARLSSHANSKNAVDSSGWNDVYSSVYIYIFQISISDPTEFFVHVVNLYLWSIIAVLITMVPHMLAFIQ